MSSKQLSRSLLKPGLTRATKGLFLFKISPLFDIIKDDLEPRNSIHLERVHE